MIENQEILLQTFSEEIYKISNRVLIIIPVEWSALEPSQVDLLSKILGSVKLSLDTVQVLTKIEINLDELVELSPLAILAFGVDLKQIPDNYKVKQYNGVPVVKAHALGLFNEEKKLSLWAALRQMFALN